MANNPLLGSFGDVSGSGLMFRNKIINGDMRIDQRNAGATITPTTTPSQAGYSLDRWRYFIAQSSKVSFARSSVAPVGFTNSLLCTSTSAYSVLASDLFQIGQIIEGFNVADLAWGSSDAKPIALSFWVRSSLTGLIGGAIVNGDGTRTYPFSYSVSAANTWEYKQIVIPGDTSGTWAKDTTAGLRLRFNLGSGSSQLAAAGAWTAGDFNGPTGAISLVGTSGATLYLAGVQVEAGPVPTPFEFRPIGMELALCQRYYERWQASDPYAHFIPFVAGGTTSGVAMYFYKQEKRIANLTLTTGGAFQAGGGTYTSMALRSDGRSTVLASIDITGSGWTTFYGYWLRAFNNAATFVGFDAEL